MLRYSLKRLLSLAISLIIASLVIFLVIEVAPGDPASFMLGINAQEDTLNALREELGLNQSKLERYLSWTFGMLQGDFGTSYTYRTPVADMVQDRLWVSLPLAIYALALSTLIAFPAGIYAASRRGGLGDVSIMGATQLGVAIPNFWFAMMLVLVFAINLRWFSAGGFPGWDNGLFTGLKALTLPAIALALPQAAILARVMRSSLLDILNEDFIRTARAKGLTPRQALWRHALRNALIAPFTVIMLQIPWLLNGVVIVETLFNYKGFGWLLVQAASNNDIELLLAVSVVSVVVVLVTQLISDIGYVFLNPRIRLS